MFYSGEYLSDQGDFQSFDDKILLSQNKSGNCLALEAETGLIQLVSKSILSYLCLQLL